MSDDLKKQVEDFIHLWIREVTSGDPNRPTNLYADDGMLWPTFSETLRTTREGIFDYFEFFCALPELACELQQLEVRRGVETAVASGTYLFTHKDSKGAPREVPARYTFTLRPNSKRKEGWEILNHHSSQIPGPPPPL